MTIQLIEIPFFQLDTSIHKAPLDAAIDALNARLAHAPNVLEVVSIETVWASRFFGIGAKQIGIRAWCRSRV
ncbi:hypothetical protein DP57_5961 [Burkholderia pseudomallei]|uniref:hypothetical protein n=1 Tax=Burkholderia pseudomallei TaxID=28450 RepID=UPI00050F4492|nr:hypothetical protein [Burkholderia pseudomallei]KGC70230.1 hypothetical protein DP57_5961 [Burkholderia pseudomallei]